MLSQEERVQLAQEASAALAAAQSADDLRRIWTTYYRSLGHRLLGRLLLFSTAPGQTTQSGVDRKCEPGPASSDSTVMALDYLTLLRRAFTVEESTELIDSEIDRELLHSALSRDRRFVALGIGTSGERYFIAASTLLRWFSQLNFRLGRANRARLSEHEFTLAIASLRARGRWEALPAQAVEFGERFGLCGSAWTSGEYVFPVAKVLSFMSAPCARLARSVLASLAEMDTLPSEEALLESVREALSALPSRNARVVLAREALATGARMTLQEIGVSLGVTRERVRQLEKRFWEKVHDPSRKSFLAACLSALLCRVMARQGSLLIDDQCTYAALVRFVARCGGVPEAELPHIGLVVIGASSSDVVVAQSLASFPAGVDGAGVASRLGCQSELCLTRSDLRALADRLALLRGKRLTKGEKVYLALKAINKPAHYSEVTQVCNLLFPEDAWAEQSIRALLGREQHRVVWIGVKGVYALKEWGYERPSVRLFDAVTEIVGKRYEATGKPVPFAIVEAEIGKYRQVVKHSSLTIATHCNPRLKRVSKDSFIPRAPGDESQDAADELDRILREFEG